MPLNDYLVLRGTAYFLRTDTEALRSVNTRLLEFFGRFDWKGVADLSASAYNPRTGGAVLRVGPWLDYQLRKNFTPEVMKYMYDEDFLFYYFVPLLDSRLHEFGLKTRLARGSNEHQYHWMLEEEERGGAPMPQANIFDLCVSYSKDLQGAWPGCGPHMYLAKNVAYMPKHLVHDI